MQVIIIFLAVASVVMLSAFLFPTEGEYFYSVPIFISILLLVPAYIWYRSYQRKIQLNRAISAKGKGTVILWILAIFALAMALRIPSVLFWGVPYEKTPLILLVIMTIILIEKSAPSAFGFSTKKFGRGLLYGLTFFLVLNVLMIAVNYLLIYALTNEMPFQAYNPLPSLVVFPFMTLCVGLSEEGFFRGYMQNHLEKSFTGATAIIGQAALFGAWHFVWNLSPFDASGMILYVLTTFLIGLLFGYFYSKTRNLTPLVFAHGLWDSAAVGITENRSAFDALRSAPASSQFITFLLPYLIPTLLTFGFLRYGVKRID